MLGGPGQDLPLSKKWKARRHDRRHPTRKKNLKEGQSGQVWKAAQRNPISLGDVTYLSSRNANGTHLTLAIEINKKAGDPFLSHLPLDCLLRKLTSGEAELHRPVRTWKICPKAPPCCIFVTRSNYSIRTCNLWSS